VARGEGYQRTATAQTGARTTMAEKVQGKSKRGGKRPGSGRKKGIPNKLSGMLKDAILKAADNAGGNEGMVGYLQTQAVMNPGPFMALLGKVLPMQVTGEDGGPLQAVFTTVYEDRG
jgi:hypothetical protein